MGKYAAAFGIGLSALVLLGIAAYTQLEIFPRPRRLPPSREARANEYLALDRWLRSAGYSLRVESRGGPGSLGESPERTAFVQASLFYWPEDAWKQLEPWVEGGGTLIISLDTAWYEREFGGLNILLNVLGIREEKESDWYGSFPGDSEPDFDSAMAFSLEEIAEAAGDEPETSGPSETLAETGVMTDHGGTIRLVRTKRGAGTVTVMGAPQFLKTAYLEREPNAVLAWNLLAPPEPDGGEAPGILFIRGQKNVQSFFGRLADRGNFSPLIVSALLLILTGLWMVIPLFGILAREDERPGRPIRERFLAEGRFLKKYRALETYRFIYIREILRRLRRREDIDDGAALNRRFSGLWEEAAVPGSVGAQELLRPGGGMNRGDFVKTVDTLETIWERL